MWLFLLFIIHTHTRHTRTYIYIEVYNIVLFSLFEPKLVYQQNEKNRLKKSCEPIVFFNKYIRDVCAHPDLTH